MQAPLRVERGDSFFSLSAFLFRIGLALVTFEQDRPFGIMLSDYCFFLSLILLAPSLKSRLLKEKGSGILLAGGLILSGALLSMQNGSSWNDAMDPLTRLFVLYGLFAPLALIHSKDIRKNMLFLIAGISVNCAITIVQAWAMPGIVDVLSINPQAVDQSEFQRFQGLTDFPVTLGLSAALAVLIGAMMVFSERRKSMRWGLIVLVLICTTAALLSGSRTFLAALVPGLIVFALLQKQRRRAVMHALIALVILWGALTYLAPGAILQYSNRLDDVGMIDYGRLAVDAQALADISQKPLLGWGVDHAGEGGLTLIPGIGVPQGAHSTLLLYWYGTGILGAIGFLALFVTPIRQMRRVLRKKLSNNSANAVRLGLAVYVSAFVIFNLGPYFYNRFLYIPVFIFAGFAAQLRGPVEVRCAPRPRLLSTKSASNLQPSS